MNQTCGCWPITAIDRHYPELADAPRKYLEFLRAVMDRQASLIAGGNSSDSSTGDEQTHGYLGRRIDTARCVLTPAVRHGD